MHNEWLKQPSGNGKAATEPTPVAVATSPSKYLLTPPFNNNY
jgi:hypothetical protein